MMWLRRWLVVLSLIVPLGAAIAATNTQEIDQRYRALSKELRCLVCQNESLAESPAGLADDLRQELRSQLENGRTDEEIKHYLVQRYGYFVLYKPPLIGRTLWLWLAPLFILIGLGGWVLTQFARREKSLAFAQTAKAQELPSDYAEQLEKIKKEFEQE